LDPTPPDQGAGGGGNVPIIWQEEPGAGTGNVGSSPTGSIWTGSPSGWLPDINWEQILGGILNPKPSGPTAPPVSDAVKKTGESVETYENVMQDVQDLFAEYPELFGMIGEAISAASITNPLGSTFGAFPAYSGGGVPNVSIIELLS
jgi:hypothetical protein